MRERRSSERVRAAGWLTFRVGDHRLREPLIDVSLTGVKAECSTRLWRGTYLEVSLELPPERPIFLAGLVLDDLAAGESLRLSFLRAGEASEQALAIAVARALRGAARSEATPATGDASAQSRVFRRSTDSRR